MIERVLFAGGGTGGHLYMAVALAGELNSGKFKTDILFVGTKKEIEKQILSSLGFRLQTIQIGALKGVGFLRSALTLLKFPASLLASVRIIRGFSPSIIVGLGGYSSGPVVLAGKILGSPTLLIEPNVYPGFTNRILFRWADGAAVAFEETARWFGPKARITGIPVRPEFEKINSDIPSPDSLRLLVFGGSQGSSPLNELVCSSLPFLPPDRLSIVHQTGITDHLHIKQVYEQQTVKAEVIDFISDMASRFARSDLILSRAGASTIAEIAASGKPSILVPLPHASDDHQRKNAQALAEKGAALVLEQEETTGEGLASILIKLFNEPSHLRRMSQAARQFSNPDSRRKILNFMQELITARREISA